MNKYPLIGGSICAVVLLVLASLTNVVGYQTVQESNQKIITTEINEKELLFQTIVDMANNKEIQRIILGSELTSKKFFDSGMKFSVFNHPVLTEKFLKRVYTMGVILSKTISKSKIHSLLEKFQISNQGMQKEITAVIEKDAKLKGEIQQFQNSQCDCDNEKTTSTTTFPIICAITELIWFGAGTITWFTELISLNLVSYIFSIIGISSWLLGLILYCDWALPVPPYS